MKISQRITVRFLEKFFNYDTQMRVTKRDVEKLCIKICKGEFKPNVPTRLKSAVCSYACAKPGKESAKAFDEAVEEIKRKTKKSKKGNKMKDKKVSPKTNDELHEIAKKIMAAFRKGFDHEQENIGPALGITEDEFNDLCEKSFGIIVANISGNSSDVLEAQIKHFLDLGVDGFMAIMLSLFMFKMNRILEGYRQNKI